MKKYILAFLLIFPCFIYSQDKTDFWDKMIVFNYANIDTSNQEILAISKLWKRYLIIRLYGCAQKNDTAGYGFWNKEEQTIYNDPDLILGIEPSLNYCETNILNIKPIENGFFRIMNVKAEVDSSGKFRTYAIYYVLVKRIDNNLKLFNYFYLAKDKLKIKQVRNITYFYPADYKFSYKKACMFLNFQDSLSVLFSCPAAKSMIYILDKDYSVLLNRLGFLSYNLMGTGSKGGQLIYKEDMILSSIDENHRHELVHYFTNRINAYTIGFFDEGLATYFGGNLGHDFQWHVNYINNYLKTRPGLDLSDVSKFGYIDDKTNPQYVLGAILVKYTIDNYGMNKVLDLLKFSSKKTNYQEVIEKELGISKADQNSFFRKYLKEYAKE